MLTEDSVFEKQEFRAKFQEEMRALRSRRAELLKAVRTDQKAPQASGLFSPHLPRQMHSTPTHRSGPARI